MIVASKQYLKNQNKAGLFRSPNDQDCFDVLYNFKLGEHFCFLYDTQGDWFNSITYFITSGIQQNHRVLYVASDHTTDELYQILSLKVKNLKKFITSGQVTFLDAQRVYTSDGFFDPKRTIDFLIDETAKTIKQDYAALRVTGEMSWALEGISGSEMLNEYESKLNSDLFSKYPCIAVCQYNLNRFPSDIIKEILRTHPELYFKGNVLDNCYYIPPTEYLNGNMSAYEVKRWLEHLLDITTKQFALNESEARYRALVELSAEVGVSIIALQDINSQEGIITYTSPQFSRMVG
ncbi:MAG: MEDS domain-containing protein, partial [Dehalococcoidales bacterium]|nr:MEDS domain-containing protein [Dehalococcoidales bacterium]